MMMNVKSGIGREMREFWDDVNDCLGMFEKGRIVVFGDMNGVASWQVWWKSGRLRE